MAAAISSWPETPPKDPILFGANQARAGAPAVDAKFGPTLGDAMIASTSRSMLSLGMPEQAEPEAKQVAGAREQGEPASLAPRRYVFRLPEPTAQNYAFDLRQQWEGVVTRIDYDEFSVVLRDTAKVHAPEYEAVLSKEEVPEEDLVLLKPGAILYWTIGYETTRTGQRKRVSSIRLRRARELEELLPKPHEP